MRAIVMIIRHVLLAEHRTAKSILVNVYPEVMIAQMATTLSPSPRTRLTPVDIDRLAAEFLELESKVDELYKLAVTADEPHERMREQLIDLVEEFGRHSERSKLLQGITHEIDTTFGVSTSIDAAAADTFAHVLRVNKQSQILDRLFERTIRYRLRPNAEQVVRQLALPKATLALYQACNVTTQRPPILKVRRIVAEE